MLIGLRQKTQAECGNCIVTPWTVEHRKEIPALWCRQLLQMRSDLEEKVSKKKMGQIARYRNSNSSVEVNKIMFSVCIITAAKSGSYNI